MRLLSLLSAVAAGMAIVYPAHAADPAAGKAIVETTCAACHGANGVSVSPRFPNLAGQRPAYVSAQLGAFKSDRRKHPMMGPIAKRMSKDDIDNVAEFLATLPGAAGNAPPSKTLANFRAKRMTLPENLDGFTHYKSFNHPRGTLRKIWANKTALDAAKADRPLPAGSVIIVEQFKPKKGADGKPVTDANGLWVADGRSGFTAMERQNGWGGDFPELIRNGDWHYGVFKPDRSAVPANQATCLACHLPLADDSFVFTLKDLKAAN